MFDLAHSKKCHDLKSLSINKTDGFYFYLISKRGWKSLRRIMMIQDEKNCRQT